MFLIYNHIKCGYVGIYLFYVMLCYVLHFIRHMQVQMQALINTTRQPFDGVSQPKTIDLKAYKIRGQGLCPPLLNLIILCWNIGLFIYVNSYFITKTGNVVNGSVYHIPTDIHSCDQYYCDLAAYNFVNYYSTYAQCNTRNCLNVICSSYNCSMGLNYDLNYYYACQALCQPVTTFPVPNPITTGYVVSIVDVCIFGLGLVVAFVYGIIMALFTKELSALERFGLLANWFWPKFKYYAFRRRDYWQNFNFNLKIMVFIDMFVNICYGITLALYIAVFSVGLWETGPEVAGFLLMIWATMTRVSMVGEVAGPFIAANRELSTMRVREYS